MARVAKPVSEKIAEIDRKIAKKRQELAILEGQKQKLLHPVNMKSVIAAAKEAGMSAEDIAKRLGLNL